MKLRFRVGRKQASKEGRKNGDIEALADAMQALKNVFTHWITIQSDMVKFSQ